MPIHLKSQDLFNLQQMDVAVNGPDGATHLVLCTGIARLSACSHEIFTFFVGPQLSRRQFVGVIASGALSTIQEHPRVSSEPYPNAELGANLLAVIAMYDEEAGQVRICTEVASSSPTTRLAISYNVSILAELPML